MAKNTNLDDLPYDEYQKEMARIEAEAAENAKNAELGNQPMPENDEHGSFDDFMNEQHKAAFGDDDDGKDASSDSDGGSGSDESASVVGDQADDPSTGDPEAVTEESNPEAFRVGQELGDKMEAAREGAERTVSGAFQNFLGGLKGLFAGGAAATMRTIANIGAKMGIPKAATYGILFILGGGTFAGMAALFSTNNDLYRYGSVSDDCNVMELTYPYHENSVYKAPTQDQLDGNAGALFNALNSDMHFKYAIRDGGTGVLDGIQDDVFDDGHEYDYVQNPSDWYDWNEDGVIDFRDDRSRHITGGYHDYDSVVKKFQDEQILGMIMAASAESNIDPSTYEMNYRVGPTEDSDGTSSYYLNESSKDMILSRSHHVQWNTYCKRMFALYAADGMSINQSAYMYTDQFGNTVDEHGDQNYYPGVGLWQWTGQRGYNLHWFANHLKDNTDADGDGANDAMYSLNVQIAYLVEIEAKPVVVNGISIPITDWGHEEVSTYQVEYYVNVPYKYGIGTAPDQPANWIPMNDYQDPSERNMVVPWDAYDQLRDQAVYKYESPTGSRLSDKNYDDARDAVYLSDSDRYNGNVTAFDDAPFPVKDYVYNYNGTIAKSESHKYGSGQIEDGTEQSDKDENGDGVIDSSDQKPKYKTVYGYDIDDDGDIDEDDLLIIDGLLDGTYPGLDIDGDGTIDVWDLNQNDKADEGEDWYIDHVAYNEPGFEDSIFIPEREVYYQNISIMVLACADGNYNASDYIYENDSHCLRQYNDTTTTIDYTHEKAKIIYQSPGITAINTWDEKPWGNGSFKVASFSETGGVSVDYNAIQEGDTWWDQLEAAREDSSNYGKETDDPRDAFRVAADTWRDQIWIWANAHARAAVGRNKGLEFCLGWLGCPSGMIESHTMFVTGGSSFAGRLDTTRYNKKADCLEHYAECMLKIDWHGNDEQGKSVTDLLYEDMDTSSVRNVWFTDSFCGGNFDNSSIAACAVSWAWLKGRNSDADVNLPVLDPGGCPKAYLCTSLYCAVHDIVYPNDPYYSSCDRGAGTAVRASGSDDAYPPGNPYMQFEHMRSNPALWQDCGPLTSMDSLEPGDIIVSTSTSSRHIIVFVGEDAVYEKWGNSVGDAKYAIVHSSHSSNLSSSRGPRCDLDGSFLLSDTSHGYRVFRCMDPDTSSSTLKKEVDAQSSSLGGLNNGDGKGGGYYAPQY